MVKIANQQINAPVDVRTGFGDVKRLEAGTLVKYIDKRYLPRGHRFDDYCDEIFVVVYCRYGLVLVEKQYLNWEVY